MHSAIIQVSAKPVKKADYIDESALCDSCTLNYVSDYYGDPLGKEERKEMIEALKGLLSGIAEWNPTRHRFEVKDRKSAFAVYTEWLKETLGEGMKNVESKGMKWDASPYHLRSSLEKFRGSSLLFTTDGNVELSADFVRDLAVGNYGDKLYVGNMLDYHF